MFFPSIEIRWFQRGAIPAQVREWFGRFDFGPVLRQERTDTYLFTHDDGMGIKLREGQVEIKQRQARLGMLTVRPHARGKVETWYKWSYPLEKNELPGNLTIPDSNWIDVAKDRLLVQSGLTVPEKSGYQVELTSVRVRRQDWWSFGIEATGAPAQLFNDFTQLLPSLLGPGCPEFRDDDSFGYAELLNRGDLDD